MTKRKTIFLVLLTILLSILCLNITGSFVLNRCLDYLANSFSYFKRDFIHFIENILYKNNGGFDQNFYFAITMFINRLNIIVTSSNILFSYSYEGNSISVELLNSILLILKDCLFLVLSIILFILTKLKYKDSKNTSSCVITAFISTTLLTKLFLTFISFVIFLILLCNLFHTFFNCPCLLTLYYNSFSHGNISIETIFNVAFFTTRFLYSILGLVFYLLSGILTYILVIKSKIFVLLKPVILLVVTYSLFILSLTCIINAGNHFVNVLMNMDQVQYSTSYHIFTDFLMMIRDSEILHIFSIFPYRAPNQQNSWHLYRAISYVVFSIPDFAKLLIYLLATSGILYSIIQLIKHKKTYIFFGAFIVSFVILINCLVYLSQITLIIIGFTAL